MPNTVLTEAIDLLANRQDLSVEQSAAVLAEIMGGNASDTQTAAVLIALRTKGETVDELVGLATTMRRLATPVTTGRDDLIDTAGTGGGRPTFNVSTTAALIAAGAGCAVAKHGNRSATGLSGSADLLEALGVRIDLAPEAVARCIEEAGFGFMFAPAHHGATRHVDPGAQGARGADDLQLPRPADQPGGRLAPGHRRLRPGVPATRSRGRWPGWAPDKALVVSSADGLDEMSTAGTTTVVEVDGYEIHSYELAPEDVGLPRSPLRRRRRRHAAAQRRRDAPDLRRRGRPRARPGGAQRGRRDLRRGAGRHASRPACAPPSRRSTRAPPRRRSTRWSP